MKLQIKLIPCYILLSLALISCGNPDHIVIKNQTGTTLYTLYAATMDEDVYGENLLEQLDVDTNWRSLSIPRNLFEDDQYKFLFQSDISIYGVSHVDVQTERVIKITPEDLLW